MSSAIPETIHVENSDYHGAICPYCGESADKPEEAEGQASCANTKCGNYDNWMEPHEWNTRSPAAALQALKALEPAARVEFITELAKGLDVVVVPRDFLDAAKCPMCDGSGGICQEHQVGSGETDGMGYEIPIIEQEWEQCQWCSEKGSLLSTAEEEKS